MEGGREDPAWGKKGTSERADKENVKSIITNYLSGREKKEKDEEFKQIFPPISKKLQITWSL